MNFRTPDPSSEIWQTGLRVRDLMTTQLLTLAPYETMYVAGKLMAEGEVRHLPVTDDHQRLLGMITQRDVLRVQIAETCGEARIREHLEGMLVEQVMTKEVVTVDPDAPLVDAAELMITKRLGGLPVVNKDGELVGIVTQLDFVGMAYRMLALDEGRNG